VQWQVSTDGGISFSDIAGAKSASFTTPPLLPAHSGAQLRVRLDNVAGVAFSDPLTVTVSPPGAGRYFPTDADSRWVYAVPGSVVPEVVRVLGTQAVDGQLGTVFQTTEPDGTVVRDVYVVTADGVRDYAAADADPIARALSGAQVLRYPVQPGSSFLQSDVVVDIGLDLDGDGRSDAVGVRSTATVLAIEGVVTLVEDFHAALHQRQDVVLRFHLSSGLQVPDGTATIDTWYADGVGMVQTGLHLSLLGATHDEVRSLAAYRVGPRRSETVPPVVRAPSPPDGGVIGANGSIGAVFSEPMDAAALAGALTLTAPDGQAVPSTVQVAGSTATLVPAQPLVSGRYVARIGTGAIDMAGNPLVAPASWSFRVDLQAPTLVESIPSDGATDVALDAKVVLRFDEAIDAASLVPGSVSFTTAGVGSPGVDVPFTTSVAGSVLTLTPGAPLQRGQAYEVRVRSVSDLAGNRSDLGVVLRFSAQAGRFAAPVALIPEGLVDAVAVGDVDGDGRADVVYTTGYTFTPTHDFKLALLLQQADGSLAPPLVLDTRAEYVCRARSVVIGDLDGDGRNDLVLGADGCGVQVFRQGADGVLRAAEFIVSAVSGRLRLADFNGDGRLDLAAAGYAGNALHVWLQAANGTLLLHASPAFDYGGGADLDVGDVNGDGRPDLVVVSRGGTPELGIGIVLQNADGSFAPAVTRSAEPPSGVSAVAVGDVDGDRRADVVVTYGGNAGRIGVMLQQPDGSLGAMTSMTSADSPSQVEIADVDGDGRLDIVVGHSGWYTMGVYLQQADGTLAAESRYPANYGNDNPGSMALGDVTGDGRVDVLVAEALLRQREVRVQARVQCPLSGFRALGHLTICVVS
jgi:hypothetical protein